MERNPEEMIRESMAPVRQAATGPMLVGRELEELCWELVTMDDPRLTAHPDWLKQFREFAWSDLDSLTLHQSARIERMEKGLKTVNDEGALRKTIEEIIAANPQSVEDYHNGKDRAIGFLVGQTMKAMKGKADPAMVNQILKELL